ncbi:MAG: pilus assembly PilX N-terminal domain-containing protein [Verrucomicrobia bacterium]|nr:pilus assembly PilX N-terminal domain-containing protein [Verrucomicrobiota bacterium]
MPESSQRENHSAKVATIPGAQGDLHAGCSHGTASPYSGFALVVVMLFLAILLGGIAVLASFVTLSQRSGSAQRNADSAQQSALFGLNVALGELQAAAGPDQRVTAPASILGNSTYTGNLQPVTGQAAWTGVWKANTVPAPNGDAAQFNPAAPDTKAFVGWLVSSTDASGYFALPAALSAPTSSSTLTANQTKTLFTKTDGTPHIQAGKVQIDDVPGGKRYFAFAVEDEGVKADLSWSETPAAATTAERAQAGRLSAAPGPDYDALNGTGGTSGPFSSLTHPFRIADSAFLKDAIAPMRDPADLQVSMNATATWLKDQRANITWGSMGILCDVKKGGLRRDLSLAFEMDGTADVTATSQPTKFNQQDGEFVGGNDRLTAPQAAQGMGGVKERYLYRDMRGSGTPFSGSITAPGSVVRGPNWWALRDYANLYKRLSGAGGNYTLSARSYYPNVSAMNRAYTLGTATGPNSGGNNWDKENHNGGGFTSGPGSTHIFRPARSNYAPVLLGSVCLFSAIATQSNGTTAKLGLGIDPFFYLWNPFNRTLTVDKLAISARYGFPGHVKFDVTRGGSTKTYGPMGSRDFLAVYGAGSTGYRALTYLVSDLTMAPGEIMVVTPSSSRSGSADAFNDEAIPGTNTDNASGVILTQIPNVTFNGTTGGVISISWQEVPLNLDTDTVTLTYSNQKSIQANLGGSEYFFLRSYLPAPGTTAKDLADENRLGEELQAIDSNNFGDISIREYYYPSQNGVVPPLGPYTARSLENTKNWFGIVSYLAKPASFSGTYPNPVEVFSQFNPAPVGSSYNDMWRPCQLNQIYNMVSKAGGANTLLQECGINFPASALNNGFWGQSYASGSTKVPMSNIPSAPIVSLASFSHAALSVRPSEPYHAVGNSWSNLFVSPVSTYGPSEVGSTSTASDSSWLINDALFDRYYLSAFAPAFTIGSGGYSATGTLSSTLTNFFSADYTSALANPVLRPYLPPGQTATDATAALGADDGYKKTGAYSLIEGVFNVNSTSVPAWTAFLRANRDLALSYAQNGGSDTSLGSPFPSSTSPAAPGNGAAALWSGFSRLNDAQVATLAEEIVKQVKLRGPFMSLSDFINHRVGTPKTTENYMGALQAAIEAANINSAVKTGAGGVAPVYAGAISKFFPDPPPIGSRTTTTGIPTDITQADLLLPLAPRLAARSDTFRIRSYGEVRSTDGTRVISQATCEAIVQRVPEYMDPVTDAASNEPWDEGAGLNQANKALGRRFKVVSFRWLNPNEI